MVREGGTYVSPTPPPTGTPAGARRPARPAPGRRARAKPADGRALVSGARLAGPGGVELFRSRDGALWAAFRVLEPNVSYPSSRYLHVAAARVEGGRLVIDAET